MSTPQTIIVDIARHKGWYIATSNSLAGLFVSSQTFTELLAEIPAVIKVLLEVKCAHEIEVHESPEPDAEDISKVAYTAEQRLAA